MSKTFNFRNLYMYLVCLITLIIFLVSTINGANSLMDTVFPNTNHYISYEDYQQRYIQSKDFEVKEDIEVVPPEYIKKEYDEYIKKENTREQQRNLKRFFSSLISMLISGGFWFYHWKKVRNEKQ
ncbi:hypothetical protein [Alkaliphilus sp. B6464]|uniref:hypothetical protein n=1 Tax=Alkaliphilus sp. B6464 TaxID=2731219 RepID=UPI001BA6C9CC|nr:hypothetical protein [Alkaliphilus sp. B6464]QUH22128.1 hypothetical protein HYG84_19670 [Alkaliphilus sp. B6464]